MILNMLNRIYQLWYGINSHIITIHHASLCPYLMVPTAIPTTAYIRSYMISDQVVYLNIGKGDVVYLNIHASASAHVSVHIVAYIQFNMKSGACKIEFTRIWHMYN